MMGSKVEETITGFTFHQRANKNFGLLEFKHVWITSHDKSRMISKEDSQQDKHIRHTGT